MSESQKKRYCYDFPHPALTVDVIVFRRRREAVEVLLVRRKRPPFAGAWAFPGGFVDENEPLERAAARELREETGIRGRRLEQLGAFGDPGRDPRGHTVTIAFIARAGRWNARAHDDADEIRWFAVGKVPELAFDHDRILEAAIRRLRKKSR